MSWRRIPAQTALRHSIILPSSNSFQNACRSVISRRSVHLDAAGEHGARNPPTGPVATSETDESEVHQDVGSQRSRLTTRETSSAADPSRLLPLKLTTSEAYRIKNEGLAERLGAVPIAYEKRVERRQDMETVMKAYLEANPPDLEPTIGAPRRRDAQKHFVPGLREESSGSSSQADTKESLRNGVDSSAIPSINRIPPDPTPAKGTDETISNQTPPTGTSNSVRRAGLDVLLAEWQTTWQSELDNRPNEEDKRELQKLYEDKARILVTRESIQPILDFLQKDSIVSSNLSRFAKWLQKRHPTEEAVRALLALVLETAPLSEDTVKLIARILLMLAHCGHGRSVERPIVSYLDALPRNKSFAHLCARIVENLCAEELGGERMNIVPKKLERWLGILMSLQKSLPGYMWRVQFRTLLKRVNTLSILQVHFSAMSNTAIAWDLLVYWMFRLPAAPSPRARMLPRAQPGEPLPMDLYMSLNTSKHHVMGEFKAIQDAAVHEPGKFDMLVELLALLRSHGLHESVMNNMACQIVGLLKDFRRPSELKVFYDRIRDHPQLEVTAELRLVLIRHYVSIGESYYAWHVFNHSPALLLDRTCYELPLLMIEKGEIRSPNIMEMLTGKRSGVKAHNTWIELAPPAFGRVVHPNRARTRREKQSLTELVDLVHLMALAWAESPHVSDRQSYRRAWECYRFLLNRAIKPRSAIIRALITASLIRTFRRTGRGLVLTKANYIIGLIRRSEGDAEAVLFERKLQSLLAETAVHQEVLLLKLGRDARRDALASLGPAAALLDRIRPVQKASQRSLLNHEPWFGRREHDKRGPPQSLVKLPDGSLLRGRRREPRPYGFRSLRRSGRVRFVQATITTPLPSSVKRKLGPRKLIRKLKRRTSPNGPPSTRRQRMRIIRVGRRKPRLPSARGVFHLHTGRVRFMQSTQYMTPTVEMRRTRPGIRLRRRGVKRRSPTLAPTAEVSSPEVPVDTFADTFDNAFTDTLDDAFPSEHRSLFEGAKTRNTPLELPAEASSPEAAPADAFDDAFKSGRPSPSK